MPETLSAKSALAIAVREVLLLDDHLASEGVYQSVADRDDELPYTIFFIRPRRVWKTMLLTRDWLREYQVVVKQCATQAGGLSAEGVAEPMKRAGYDLLTQTVGGVAAQDRMNGFLESLGWTATKILEVGDVPEYSDVVGANRDIRRWHFGHLFDVRISKF